MIICRSEKHISRHNSAQEAGKSISQTVHCGPVATKHTTVDRTAECTDLKVLTKGHHVTQMLVLEGQ